MTTTNSGPSFVNPCRAAVPFWGQTTQILSGLSPKRDCGIKRVNVPFDAREEKIRKCFGSPSSLFTFRHDIFYFLVLPFLLFRFVSWFSVCSFVRSFFVCLLCYLSQRMCMSCLSHTRYSLMTWHCIVYSPYRTTTYCRNNSTSVA